MTYTDRNITSDLLRRAARLKAQEDRDLAAKAAARAKQERDENPQPVELIRVSTMSGAVSRFLGAVAALFINAWVLMLEVGALHSQVHAVPAVGYWAAFFALMAVGTIGYHAGIRAVPWRLVTKVRKGSGR